MRDTCASKNLLRLETTIQAGDDFGNRRNGFVAEFDACMEHPRVAFPVFGEADEVVKHLETPALVNHTHNAEEMMRHIPPSFSLISTSKMSPSRPH